MALAHPLPTQAFLQAYHQIHSPLPHSPLEFQVFVPIWRRLHIEHTPLTCIDSKFQAIAMLCIDWTLYNCPAGFFACIRDVLFTLLGTGQAECGFWRLLFS